MAMYELLLFINDLIIYFFTNFIKEKEIKNGTFKSKNTYKSVKKNIQKEEAGELTGIDLITFI